jgi:hypothetical protein
VIDGSVNLNAASTMPATIKRGAIAVLRIGADRPGTRLLLQLLTELHRERLRASALPLTLQNE